MHKILQFGHEVIKYKGVDYYTVIVVVRLVQVELRHNTRVSAVYGSCNTLGWTAGCVEHITDEGTYIAVRCQNVWNLSHCLLIFNIACVLYINDFYCVASLKVIFVQVVRYSVTQMTWLMCTCSCLRRPWWVELCSVCIAQCLHCSTSCVSHSSTFVYITARPYLKHHVHCWPTMECRMFWPCRPLSAVCIKRCNQLLIDTAT